MRCPKCGQIYVEGSQRFCDMDGARLLSGNIQSFGEARQRIFATILPVVDHRSTATLEHDEISEPLPVTMINGPFDDKVSGDFFDADGDDEAAQNGSNGSNGHIIEKVNDVPRSLGRRVTLDEIPPGHIEIDKNGDREHPSIVNPAFDPDRPESFLGKVVKGRYTVVDLLGDDDSGCAFLGEDRLDDARPVMVRILASAEIDEVTAHIFAEERISLSHLNHPNVVRVFDSGELADGSTFLISEHIDGLTVADVLHINGQMDADRVARIIRQAGVGLGGVHKQGILHRDLRAEDLVLYRSDDEPETVKLLNFGVSDGSPKDENLGYKAPEVLEGKIPTTASDIYSLGVIAYMMLTATLPFEYRSKKDLLERERDGLSSLPTSFRRDLGPVVDQVFEKVLAPEPLKRYVTSRDFGEALYTALTVGSKDFARDEMASFSSTRIPVIVARNGDVSDKAAVADPHSHGHEGDLAAKSGEAAWARRSPEPPKEPGRKWINAVIIAIGVLALIAAGVWYYLLSQQHEPAVTIPPEQALPAASIDPASQRPDGTIEIEVPPLPRHISQPPNTDYFQNSRQNLKGDLLRNFVGFIVYYPKSWRSAGPEESALPGGRGKFLDISVDDQNGELKEQLLISYYPSTGTYTADALKFPELSREANETLKKLIPNYQLVSEGESSVNGGWRAYEVKFQGSGVSVDGKRLLVWGRRLFIPAGRPGVRAGFEITMLATSNTDNVHSVEDVGNQGELAQIFETFEPSQNF